MMNKLMQGINKKGYIYQVIHRRHICAAFLYLKSMQYLYKVSHAFSFSFINFRNIQTLLLQHLCARFLLHATQPQRLRILLFLQS